MREYAAMATALTAEVKASSVAGPSKNCFGRYMPKVVVMMYDPMK
jgi:hypothetical protein